MGAKGSAEAAAKLNADNWGHLEVCICNEEKKKRRRGPWFREFIQFFIENVR